MQIRRQLFYDFDEIIGHHQYTQLVKEVTWERSIENSVKSSVIDHIYCTDRSNVESVIYRDTILGDHKLVILSLANKSSKEKFHFRKRSWRKYSKEMLIEYLEQVQWNVAIDDVQEMWNWFEHELHITDKLVPYEDVRVTIKRRVPSILIKQHNANVLLSMI